MPSAPEVRLEARMPSHPRYLQFVRAVAGEGASLAGFDDEARERIELAAVEGFTNIIRHGYRGRTDEAVDLRLVAPAGRLRIEFDDRGTFVDPRTFASRPLDQVRPGGLGVHLMRSAMDVVDYRRNAYGGTTLVLEKRLASSEGSPR